jgi:hypothetical protein
VGEMRGRWMCSVGRARYLIRRCLVRSWLEACGCGCLLMLSSSLGWEEGEVNRSTSLRGVSGLISICVVVCMYALKRSDAHGNANVNLTKKRNERTPKLQHRNQSKET